ncbi:hypothetical protein BJ170DRAFT_399900 [Xylariales sp. AK1849]|nr:hypothetical protein BJ170DRAFT_399900 [Xylariales sp. AK1849]
MPALDPRHQNRILVTGANGFIGNHIIKLLLASAQYRIDATVRTVEKSLKLQDVHGRNPLLTVHIVPDFTNRDAFARLAGYCDAIIHLASPFVASNTDFERELLIPSIQGVQAVCHAANVVDTVKRLVYCSSFAAVFDPSSEGSSASKVYTEDDWNPTTYEEAKGAPAMILAYQASKALAEREAWNICHEQTRWDMVSLCPGVVFGAPVEGSIATVRELGQSNGIIWGLFDKKEVPETRIPIWTSVLSLAEAHISALSAPGAGNERFLLISGIYENQRLCDIIRASDVGSNMKSRVPLGNPGHRDTDGFWKADASKAARYLDFSSPTLEDTVMQLKEHLLLLERKP